MLLSNDDGYRATGIETLRARLQEFADVILFAPEFEQSAMSHALTLHRPLRLYRIDDKTFALDGTPADCVYLALIGWDRWFKRRPDFVVSGINHGPNLGQDVFYSGTVAAAKVWKPAPLPRKSNCTPAGTPPRNAATTVSTSCMRPKLPQ